MQYLMKLSLIIHANMHSIIDNIITCILKSEDYAFSGSIDKK